MAPSAHFDNEFAEHARREAEAHSGENPRPLGGYVALQLSYGSLVALSAAIAADTGRSLPQRWPTQDLPTVALDTQKFSRTLAKDAVTSPLRAPFADYTGTGGSAEVMEKTRHSGQLRHALGELMTCPFCLDVWMASGFVVGLVFMPRLTRLVAGTFAALAGADFLQLAYAKAQQAAQTEA